MKTMSVLLVLAFSALVLADAKSSGTMVPAQKTGATPGPPTTLAPNTTTHAPNTTTHAPNTTTLAPNTTTHAPNTTTHAPTTTTLAPNTTTHAPNTTTHAPNTTTLAPNTTTLAPNTTTHAPTTTMSPTTTQPPQTTNSTVGNYTLDNGKHRCLMAQMELKIRLVSEKANGTFLLLPNKTRTAGDCNDNHAKLVLISDELNMTLSFAKNDSMKNFFVNMLAFSLTYDFSKKSNEVPTYNVDNQSIHIFEAKIGKSYSCRKESLYMGKDLYLDIAHDRMQAFNFTNSKDFGPTDPCPADQNNYRVAIAVGITLLVLVVVVVIAYLLARKKRNDGYQSL